MSIQTENRPRERSLHLGRGVPGNGPTDARSTSPVPWRVSPQPFPLKPQTVARLEIMGSDLFAFYQAANRLHLSATRGHIPEWALDYLDRGKTERVLELGNLRRTRSQLPRIIRPDLMALENGTLCATELDAVPGGFGALAALTQRYADLGFDPVGGANGIPAALAAMFRDVGGMDAPNVGIVVSDESGDYRGEMDSISEALRSLGVDAYVLHPSQLTMKSDALCFECDDGKERPADVVYRFFELHDLPNVQKLDLIIYALKHRRTVVTPPFKAYLEEKLLFALFRHPELATFWNGELGADVVDRLQVTLVPTWVLDPSSMPPFAAINPPLVTAGRQVHTWNELPDLTQRQRRLVIKPSGFSELAWGARGVTVGHDVAAAEWKLTVDRALGSFTNCPHVIQPYQESRRVQVQYFDFEADELRPMEGRARISPFYIVAHDKVNLGGVLVTVVPAANKVIHGTPEAVIAPAVVSENAII